MKRWLKQIVISVFVLILILIGFVGWLIATESGFRFLIVQAQNWAPGQLTVNYFEGRLLDKFSLRGLVYQHDELAVHLTSFDFNWNPRALFQPKLQVKQLHVKGLDIKLPPSQPQAESSEPISLPEIRLPLTLALEDIAIQQLTLRMPATEPVVIDHISFQTTTTHEAILPQLQIESTRVQAHLDGQMGLQAPHAVDLNLAWSVHWPQLPPLAGQAQLTGNSQQLKINHHLSQPFAMNLNATVDDILAELQFTAQLNWPKLHWPLTEQQPTVVLSQHGQLSVNGNLQHYQLELATELSGAQIPQGQWQLTAQGTQQQLTLEKLQAQLLSGQLTAEGQVNWQPALAAQVKLQTEDLTLKPFWAQWPQQLTVNSQLIAELAEQKFNIQKIKIEIPQTATQLTGQGQGTLTGPVIDQAQFTWNNLRWPLAGAITQVNSAQGQIEMTGQLDNYRVNLATDLATPQIPALHLSVKGHGSQQQFLLEQLQGELLQGTVNANGRVAWQPQLSAQVNLTAEQLKLKPLWPDWPDELTLQSQLKATLEDKDFKMNQLNIEVPETSTQLALQGQGVLAGAATQFKTQLNWDNLHWPLVGQPNLVTSAQGQLQAEGQLQDYQLQLSADIAGKDIPQGQWQAVGQGDNRQLQLESLQGQILQGKLNLSGVLQWQPHLDWQLALTGQGLNPGSQWPQWPGQIALDMETQGQLQQGQLQTQVTVKQIHGQLRNYPLQIQTQLAVEGDQYQIKTLEVHSGEAYLTADGTLAPTASQLQWNIQVPDLAALLPQASGSLKGQGDISGVLKSPQVVAQLTAQDLAYQAMQLKQLDADVNVDLAKNLAVTLTATDFKQGQTQLERLNLTTQGTLAAHILTLDAKMPENQLTLQLQGGYQQPNWQGQLQQLTATSNDFGDWQIPAPVALKLSPAAVELAQLCLQQQQAALCTQLAWQQAGPANLEAQLKAIPLNIAHSFFPADLAISGEINGHVKAELQAQGQLTADTLITISPGELTTVIAEEHQTFPHQGGQLQVEVNALHGLTAQLELAMLEQSGINGQIQLPRLTQVPPQGDQPLQGQIQAKFADLKILPTLVPQAENSRGKVLLDLNLGGQLTQPELQGELRVVEAGTELTDVGLELKAIEATVRSESPQTINLDASVHSGAGQLQLNGQAQLLSFTDWNAQLTIEGERFEAVNTPTVWALASPDLEVKLTPGKIKVKGQVLIPEAMITPPEAESSAVSASEDVVFIDAEQSSPEETAADGFAIITDVQIILGEKVTFKGAGFKSRFTGAILAITRPDQITRGNGELRIVEGSYKAYGQNLKINQGRIIFPGGPIENPGLDIRAIRHIERTGNEDVQAGVLIQGTAQSPKISLFSTPSMDQTNTLSYILLGKPAAQATQSEGNTLLSAAASMQLDEGDSIVKDIGQQFGLDEATIASDGGVEESELVLGKYLSPRLYISYGIGLFDGNTVLRLRYDLTKRLTLETETGTQSGVDLRYTIER